MTVNTNMNNSKGFSLVEMLVVMGLMAIGMVAVLTIQDNQSKVTRDLDQKNEMSSTQQLLSELLKDKDDCYSTFKDVPFDTIIANSTSQFSLKTLNTTFSWKRSPLKTVASANIPILCGDRNLSNPQGCWAISGSNQIKFNPTTTFSCSANLDCSTTTGLACYLLFTGLSCQTNPPENHNILGIGHELEKQVKITDLVVNFDNFSGSTLDGSFAINFDKSNKHIGSSNAKRSLPIRFELDGNKKLLSCGLGGDYLTSSEICSAVEDVYNPSTKKCETSPKNQLKLRKYACMNEGGRLVDTQWWTTNSEAVDCDLDWTGEVPEECRCLKSLTEFRTLDFKSGSEYKRRNGVYGFMDENAVQLSHADFMFPPINIWPVSPIPSEDASKGIFKLQPFSWSKNILNPTGTESGGRFYQITGIVCGRNRAASQMRMTSTLCLEFVPGTMDCWGTSAGDVLLSYNNPHEPSLVIPPKDSINGYNNGCVTVKGDWFSQVPAGPTVFISTWAVVGDVSAGSHNNFEITNVRLEAKVSINQADSSVIRKTEVDTPTYKYRKWK
jgi:prepilin-type N-terminal cleavage/methylation domain-containing protein